MHLSGEHKVPFGTHLFFGDPPPHKDVDGDPKAELVGHSAHVVEFKLEPMPPGHKWCFGPKSDREGVPIRSPRQSSNVDRAEAADDAAEGDSSEQGESSDAG